VTDIAIRGLLRLYPRAWRVRYGDELAGLILQASGGRGPSMRLSTNVALAGVRERLRAVGLLGNDLTPGDRTQSGVLLVLWSWMLFVLGGIGVQKAAEHWTAAVPATKAGVPEVAFGVLVVVAAIGSVLVLAGIAYGARAFAPFLGAGGWGHIRRPIYRASAITALTAIGLLTLSIWAHHLTVAQRNGHTPAYSAAVLIWALLFAGCLFTWAAAAVSAVRYLNLKPRLLTIETRIAAAVTATMATMTIASAIWWAAVAHSAPWFFAGTPAGTRGTVAPINLLIPVGLMLTATLLASLGTRRSLHNARLMA
jgi:hypothetical protein